MQAVGIHGAADLRQDGDQSRALDLRDVPLGENLGLGDEGRHLDLQRKRLSQRFNLAVDIDLDGRIGVRLIPEELDGFGIGDLQIRDDQGCRRRSGGILYGEFAGLQRQSIENNERQPPGLPRDGARRARRLIGHGLLGRRLVLARRSCETPLFIRRAGRVGGGRLRSSKVKSEQAHQAGSLAFDGGLKALERYLLDGDQVRVRVEAIDGQFSRIESQERLRLGIRAVINIDRAGADAPASFGMSGQLAGDSSVELPLLQGRSDGRRQVAQQRSGVDSRRVQRQVGPLF